jgi:hypothetical protein
VSLVQVYLLLLCLELSIPDLNLESLPSEVTKGMILKELLMDENVRRLQEVVDKEPYHDDQATYAIIVGMRGHKTCKVGQATHWTKSWEMSCYLYLVS